MLYELKHSYTAKTWCINTVTLLELMYTYGYLLRCTVRRPSRSARAGHGGDVEEALGGEVRGASGRRGGGRHHGRARARGLAAPRQRARGRGGPGQRAVVLDECSYTAMQWRVNTATLL